MLWVGPLALAALTSAAPTAPARWASTYDEAACAEGAREAEAARARDADAARAHDDAARPDGPDCSEPPPPPAVIDCNDQRASLWVGEMIGSCDMPRPSLPQLAPTVRGQGQAGARLCDGLRCGDDSNPIRPASRVLDDGHPLALTPARQPPRLEVSPLVDVVALGRSQADRPRLERPPRA